MITWGIAVAAPSPTSPPNDALQPPTRSRARRRHLGRRAFAVSLIVIVVLTAFGYGALRANLDQNQRDAIRGVGRTARLAGALGTSIVALAQQEVSVLSRSPAIVDGDVVAIQRAINLANPLLMGFNAGMAWIDTTGATRASWSLPDTDTVDFASLPVVAAAAGGEPAVAALAGVNGTPIRPVVFAVPTKDADGIINGVLAGAVLLDSSSQEQLRLVFGTDALVVVDETGAAVFGNQRTTAANVAVAAETQRRSGDRANGVFRRIDDSVVGYSRIPSAGWVVVVERPREDLFGPSRWQFERSLFALGLLFAMSVVGAAFAAIRLDRVHRRESDSRQLFQTVIEQLPVGVAALDRHGRIVVTNDRADLALGSAPAPGDDAPVALAVATDAMRDRTLALDADVQVGEGDDTRTLIVRAAPVESAGHVTGAAAIVEDVTQLRERARRAEHLAAATAGLALATSREEVASVVADGVSAFGARGAVVVLRDEREPERLLLASAAGFGAGKTDGWETMSIDASTPVSEAVRTGEVVIATIDDAAARFPDMGDLFAASGNQAWAALPLRSAGRVDGALGLSFRDVDDLSGDARPRLAGFAAQVSQALDRVSRQSIEHDVAMVLQRGLLQAPGGEVVDLEVASSYEPAEDHLEVGGDFYDVLPLEDGGVMLVIGDVVGHGLDAASAMGQLRSAVRALASTTSSPARVLELLDRFAAVVPSCRFSTAAIVVIDATRRRLTYSIAGHPPPGWCDADGVSGLLDGALSRPLGVYPAARPERTRDVTPGTTVCLYTDGLIERRGEIIDAGIGRLVASLAAGSSGSCEALVASLFADLVGDEPQRDDVAILCARV